MAKAIREVMTSNPTTIEPTKSVADAAKIMKKEDAGIVPVVDGDQLAGTITDRDIAIRVVADGKDPQSTKVRDIMSTQIITIDPQQNVDEAARLMAQHQVRRLPVVEEDGKLVGIVAQADIATQADAAKTGQMVEQISQ
jgi:CBS domain-containing protein